MLGFTRAALRKTMSLTSIAALASLGLSSNSAQAMLTSRDCVAYDRAEIARLEALIAKQDRSLFDRDSAVSNSAETLASLESAQPVLESRINRLKASAPQGAEFAEIKLKLLNEMRLASASDFGLTGDQREFWIQTLSGGSDYLSVYQTLKALSQAIDKSSHSAWARIQTTQQYTQPGLFIAVQSADVSLRRLFQFPTDIAVKIDETVASQAAAAKALAIAQSANSCEQVAALGGMRKAIYTSLVRSHTSMGISLEHALNGNGSLFRDTQERPVKFERATRAEKQNALADLVKVLSQSKAELEKIEQGHYQASDSEASYVGNLVR